MIHIVNVLPLIKCRVDLGLRGYSIQSERGIGIIEIVLFSFADINLESFGEFVLIDSAFHLNKFEN